jgi:hypothetical protein
MRGRSTRPGREETDYFTVTRDLLLRRERMLRELFAETDTPDE